MLLISYFVDYSSEKLMIMINNDKVVINYNAKWKNYPQLPKKIDDLKLLDELYSSSNIHNEHFLLKKV